MSDQPIDLDARRKAKAEAAETTTESPTMKPNFDPETYFKGVLEQNRKAKAKEVEAKAKRNKLTKQRYRIEDKPND